MSIWAFVERRCLEKPEAAAIVGPFGTLSYGELCRQVIEFSSILKAAGIGAGELVAVHASGSPDSIVALLAVLRLQAIYLLVEPSELSSRQHEILATCGARFLVCDDVSRRPLSNTLSQDIIYMRTRADRGGEYTDDLAHAVTPIELNTPAYVYYTSGSTGTPKAVMGTHDSVVNRYQWLDSVCPYRDRDVVFLRAPASAVMSAWEIFSPLLAGVALLLTGYGQRGDPRGLLQLSAAFGATHFSVVPSLAKVLLELSEELFASQVRLRILEIGGEASPPGLIRDLAARLPFTTIIHRYGSTEMPAAVCKVIRPGDIIDDVVSVGAPISGVHAAIVDDTFEVVPVGCEGTLCLGGRGLSIGYANGPSHTAARYIAGQVSGGQGVRLYVTGDRARISASNEIEILGRSDFMLKIAGHRIDPSEVEAAIVRHSSVGGAVVMDRIDGTGLAELVAFVRPELSSEGQLPSAWRIDAEEMRRFLLAALPPFMVPAYFVPMAEFPLLPGGKLDRECLAASIAEPRYPDSSVDKGSYRDLAAELWAEVLGVTELQQDSNFLDLGGDSLSALRIVARLEEHLNISVSVNIVFDHPTFRNFVGELDIITKITDGNLRFSA
jgi:amino acid adenylation domain-containing protein